MSSKIVLKFPPNYADIKDYLNPPAGSIYAYDNVIYNPSERQIYEDEEIHEQVHFKQQGKQVKVWWNKYLRDKDFRLSQEVEAYHAQLMWLREKGVSAKDRAIALSEMAKALSTDYAVDIDLHKARTLVKIGING